MTLASTSTSRWAVSARSSGEVLSAGIVRSELELVVLGVPSGFSQPEIEGWLHDLAGVAVETSKSDSRARAIPALLHHALTGLLFSHAELWDRLELPRPCSSAFVDLPEGAAFGWVGDARVHVLVDGDPVEPQWVLVRDEAGREARSAVFAPGSDIVVTLEYWPQGEDGAPAPASLEAEWVGAVGAAEPAAAWPVEGANAHAAPPVGTPEAPGAPAESAGAGGPADVAAAPAEGADPLVAESIASALYPELPESLPMHQPGLAEHPYEQSVESPSMALPGEAGEARPEEPGEPQWTGEAREAGSEEIAEPQWTGEPATVTANEPLPGDTPVAAVEPAFEEPAEQSAGDVAAKPQHPVARWLSRVMNWGRRAPREVEPVIVEESAAPVSAYDSLLSESVEPATLEQTTFDLEAAAPDANAGAPGPAAPEPAPAAGAAGLRPAGIAEILGGAPSPADSPSGSFAVNERLQALLREIEAADAGHLPVLAPQVPAAAHEPPLDIDHEPVGADESFGIPPLPRPASEPPADPIADDRVVEIPRLPVARVVVAAPPPPHRLAPVEAAPAAVPQVAAAPETAPQAAAAPPPPAVRPVDSTPPVEAAGESWQQEPAATAGPPALPAALLEPTLAAFESPAPAGERPLELEPLAPGYLAPQPAPELPTGYPFLEPRVQAGPAGARRARTLESPEETTRPKLPLHRRPAVWAAGVVVVFLVGWLVGGLASPSADRGGPFGGVLRLLGIGGAHFTVSINSSPGGAHIEIDGKPQATRTPATLELAPGDHTVRLLLPGLGGVTVPLAGRGGEKLTIDEPLNGSLEILDADSSVPISVSIDGRPAGYAPLKVESIAPGLHEVHFSGPGMPAWVQTLQVDVRGTAQIVARPMSAPANGVIQVQATINDESGSAPLSGAQVHVDGQLRGVTPLSIELPRGPHSLRVVWRGESAPVQVIDLPGGNQRFAAFQFGLDVPPVQLAPVGNTRTIPAGQSTIVSASVTGLSPNDVGEAWLRVRSAEGLWRRYAMTPLRSAGQLVVASVFPESAFDRNGQTRWYVSVTTKQGDEYYSEMQQTSLAGAPGKPAASRSQP